MDLQADAHGLTVSFDIIMKMRVYEIFGVLVQARLSLIFLHAN